MYVMIGEIDVEGVFECFASFDVFELTFVKLNLGVERDGGIVWKNEFGCVCECVVGVVKFESVVEEGVDVGLGVVVDFGIDV